MDAKAKIDEMLRNRRAIAEQANNQPNTIINVTREVRREPMPALTQPSIPAPIQMPVQTSSPLASDTHSTTLDRISAMLKQRQSPLTTISVVKPADNSGAISQILANQTLANQTIVNRDPAVSEVAVIRAEPIVTERRDLCRACLNGLTLQEGLFICANCHCRYIRQPGTNQFLDIVELPCGHCDCCEVRAPLVKTIDRQFPHCPISRETYVPVAGRAIRLSKLPFGLCLCCPMPQILMATQDQAIRCPASGNQYLRNIDGTIVQKPLDIPLPDVDTIESALNDGNAAFYYGGFIGQPAEQTQPERTQRRRRR